MEEVGQRLKDTTAECIACYEAWSKDKKNEEARENLAEAIHELRKVASRVEIDMAVSEREQMASRPISIPPHRSQRKIHAGGDEMPFGDDEDDDVGNIMPDSNESNNAQPRRASGGGGGGKRAPSRGRRPNPNRGNE